MNNNTTNNISNFPLYKILLCKIKEIINITNEDIKLFINFVYSNEDKHEIIYTIIRLFYLNNNKNSSEIFNIPYNGIQNKSDYSFDFNNFPIQLQQMLIQFVKIN